MFSLQGDPDIKSRKTYSSYLSRARKWLAAKKGFEVDERETKKRVKAVGKRFPVQRVFNVVFLQCGFLC